MIQLYLYVEGQTEQTFADTLLRPHLAHFGVHLMGSILAQTGRRHGMTFRGGVLKYAVFKEGLFRILKQHNRAGVYVSTMVDFYRMPKDFPQPPILPALPLDQVVQFENALASDIGQKNFIPYIQLHEFEALLFANPADFALFYHDKKDALKVLQKIAEEFPNPELIDKGEQTAPSKRILAALPDYEKTVVGPQVAELIGLETIRKKCRHFSDWVASLESLGTGLPTADESCSPPTSA